MGACRKQVVTCVITDERTGVSYEQTNLCRVGGDVCPRVEAGYGTGEGYELCGTTHAEIMALRYAHYKGATLEGATARIYGHTYVCQDCREALREAGIKRILVRGKEVTNDT